MLNPSIGRSTRQSVSLLNSSAQQAPKVVAVGEPEKRSGAGLLERPRLVTRGHLIQEDVISPSLLSKSGCVDWYAFTLPCEGKIKPSQVALEVSEWLPPFTGFRERGIMGYTQGLMLPGEGMVLWNDDRPDMGVHVELPSKCLKLVEVEAVQLAGWVHLRGGQCTRIDIALDTDGVSMAQVVNAQDSGDLVARSKKRLLMYNYEDGSQTLYVGSTKSRRLVRFYDKALEQQSKTGEQHPGVWTRCEVQFRREQAQMVSEYIGLGAGLRDVIFSCVDFRDSTQDENLSRCDRLEWWQAWVGEAERLSFATGSVVGDVVAEAYTWVQKYVAPTLAFLSKALGSASLDALVEAANGRIPEYRLRVLAAMT